jgi:hypothetical protein
MTLQQLKKEIKELKSSIISETQPAVKIFVFKIGGQITTEDLTATDVCAYEKAHPRTKILRLQRADFRKKVSE